MHLDRLVAVLEAVASAGRAVSPADVQRHTRIPRPTCYRLLQSLAESRELWNLVTLRLEIEVALQSRLEGMDALIAGLLERIDAALG